MKKTLIILILGLSFFNCKQVIKSKNKVDIEKPAIKKELRFCLKNSSQFDLKDITVGLPDTVLIYKQLKKQSQTNWVSIESAYHYGFVRFYDEHNQKYYIQPIDYVGETLFKKGTLKFIVKSIDTIEHSFELDSDYKKNQ